MNRRQGVTLEMIIGSRNQSNRRCQAPLSVGSGALTVGVSEGASQYRLVSAEEPLAIVLAKRRSAGAAVIVNFRSAPTCSWNALIILRILRANHTPATKNAS